MYHEQRCPERHGERPSRVEKSLPPDFSISIKQLEKTRLTGNDGIDCECIKASSRTNIRRVSATPPRRQQAMHSLTKRRLVASEDDHEHNHQSEVGHGSDAEGPRIKPLRDGVDEQRINGKYI